MEAAWQVGLHDNTTGALHTLHRWYQDGQAAQQVASVDLCRDPASLPWECEAQLEATEGWQQADGGRAQQPAILDLCAAGSDSLQSGSYGISAPVR